MRGIELAKRAGTKVRGNRRTKPLKRGQVVRRQHGQAFTVVSCVKIPCRACGGHGVEWEVKLRDRYGAIFKDTANTLALYKYVVVSPAS